MFRIHHFQQVQVSKSGSVQQVPYQALLRGAFLF